MRLRVSYSADVPDWWRREIRAFYGRPGLATRAECVEWLRTYGTSQDDNLANALLLELEDEQVPA